ncbi:MAG: N-acetylneuraminate synthase [Candidatus Thermoplasmatota archaeon]|nr:N-acetylneuraminate synthase [Candidatus Thermoplasmatota archaeon]
MNRIQIGKKSIGESYPCFIIAEAGVNHNGKLHIAKKLVDAAVTAGADSVKFQIYTPEQVATKEADLAEYARINIGKDIRQIDLLKKVSLSYKDFAVLKEYCDKNHIVFLATPHSFDAIDYLDDIIPAFKFGSGDLTNIPALKHAATKHKPLILGTGMATMIEVKDAIFAIRSTGNKCIVALHCTTNYPCPYDEVNLRAMQTMKKKLPCLIGYSDHTLGITVPIMSVALGAVVLEKHLTLDKNLPGPDHKASLEPAEFRQMVTEIRNAEQAMGKAMKKPTSSEKKILGLVRKSIVAKKFIPKGTVISNEMITMKRPGTGLKPSKINNLIGKKTKRNISEDELLKLNMVE